MTVKEVMIHIGCSRNTVMKYKRKGLLSAKKDANGHLVFNEREVRKMAVKYDDNIDQGSIISRSKRNIPPPVPINPPVKDVITHIKENSDDESILNEFGKQELMRATTRLQAMNIYDLADKGVINRYAIAIQMQNKYLNDLMAFDSVEEENMRIAFENNKEYTPRSNQGIVKLYDMFSKQVMNYEKTLGLTPESMSKLNPPPQEQVDEMETFING